MLDGFRLSCGSFRHGGSPVWTLEGDKSKPERLSPCRHCWAAAAERPEYISEGELVMIVVSRVFCCDRGGQGSQDSSPNKTPDTQCFNVIPYAEPGCLRNPGLECLLLQKSNLMSADRCGHSVAQLDAFLNSFPGLKDF